MCCGARGYRRGLHVRRCYLCYALCSRITGRRRRARTCTEETEDDGSSTRPNKLFTTHA